jgi:hypothetical protein
MESCKKYAIWLKIKHFLGLTALNIDGNYMQNCAIISTISGASHLHSSCTNIDYIKYLPLPQFFRKVPLWNSLVL